MTRREEQGKNRSKPGHVRIIAGEWRGRRIPVLDSEGLRPSGDRVRETLFNWLARQLPGTECLDLFAGTGVLGFEALSRGAQRVVFVERDQTIAARLGEMALELGASGAEVSCVDALKYLRGAPRAFDVVFVDPPFAGPDHGELCTLIARGWLRPHGMVYLEMARTRALPDLPAGWALHRERTAGQVRVVLIRSGESALPRDASTAEE